jgi:hypothetical protein
VTHKFLVIFHLHGERRKRFWLGRRINASRMTPLQFLDILNSAAPSHRLKLSFGCTGRSRYTLAHGGFILQRREIL